MFQRLIFLMLASGVFSSAFAGQTVAERLQMQVDTVGAQKFTSSDHLPGIVRHVVLFRYLDSVTAAQREDAKQRFLALAKKSLRDGKPYIVSIETGLQNSGQGTDQNFEQGFIVTFKSEGDRNYYVGLPFVKDAKFRDGAHQAFKEFVRPLLAPSGILVFDFRVGT